MHLAWEGAAHDLANPLLLADPAGQASIRNVHWAEDHSWVRSRYLGRGAADCLVDAGYARGKRNRFGDRLRVRGVVLLSLDERLHVDRCNQPHLATERHDLPAPSAQGSPMA